MTKYILHGGATIVESIHNDNFFKEMIKDLESPVKILLVYYASDKEKWNDLFNDDQDKLNKASGGNKKLEFIMATTDIELLKQQIKEADVVYMRGGRFVKVLVDTLKKIDSFSDLIKDKVVAGSSAGAYALSKYYFSNFLNSCGSGLGILPIKCLAHYNLDEYRKNLGILESSGEDLKIYKIPETEFIVINK